MLFVASEGIEKIRKKINHEKEDNNTKKKHNIPRIGSNNGRRRITLRSRGINNRAGSGGNVG